MKAKRIMTLEVLDYFEMQAPDKRIAMYRVGALSSHGDSDQGELIVFDYR